MVAVLAYLAETFEEHNKLNSTRQGKQTHYITLSDKVSAFTKKRDLWKIRLFQGNIEMFDQLYEITEKPENFEINKQLLINLISEHIQSSIVVSSMNWFKFVVGKCNESMCARNGLKTTKNSERSNHQRRS